MPTSKPQEQMINNSLRVAVITTSDVVAQAIVQGISIALTGSPLGKEIDIHCFPAPDLSLYSSPHLHRGQEDDDNHDDDQITALYSPPPSSLPAGMISRHSISPHSLSYPHPTSLHSEQNLSFLRSSLVRPSPLASTQRSPPTTPQPLQRPPLLESNDRDCKVSACQKARLAFNLYQERFGRSCEYAVGIVFCVARDEDALSNDRLSTDSSLFLDQSLSYHIYYWIAIFDGVMLNTSRSASIVLPPSLCAHIQSKTADLPSPRGEMKSMTPQRLSSEFHSEIDVEEELIAAILRLGQADGDEGLMNPTPLDSNRNSHFSIAHALSGGIVGWLTSGKISRAHYLQSAIQLAFIPFQWKDLFEVTDV
jgi:hypothetical protein